MSPNYFSDLTTCAAPAPAGMCAADYAAGRFDHSYRFTMFYR